MKKIFLFLAVASTSIFVSCSNDDGPTTDPNAATAIVLAADLTTIETGQSVAFTVTDNNALDVTAASTITANDVAITGATFTPTVAGTYTIKATHSNTNNVVLTSNTLTIEVADPVVALPNSIFVDGQNYPITNSILVFFGGYAADPNATVATHGLFSYIMTDDATGNVISNPASSNNYIDVEIIVPIVDGNVVLPTPANASYLDVYEAYVGGTEIDFTTQESGSMVLATLPTAINMPHTFSSSTSYNLGSTLVTTFSGNWLGFLDATAKPAPLSLNTPKSLSAKLFTKEQVLKNKANFLASLRK